MPDVISFPQALEATANTGRNLLLGNGFSIAQGGGEFSYSNLMEYCGLPDGSPIRNVFHVLETVDFEEVMHALEHASKIEEAYGDADRSTRFRNDASGLREALIHAVREVHPGIQFDIPEDQRTACAEFLSNFARVFTLNYDLLLYWVILHAPRRQFTDGFGLGPEENGFREFSLGAYCSVHYLHGALHLFLGSQKEILKRIVTNAPIVDDIASTIRRRRQLPLFVAEGTPAQKIAKINSVPYLRHCYDKLCDAKGCLFVLGHSASQNDRHIYDAIARSRISQIYFCVHEPERNLGAIREALAPFIARNERIEINYVEAASTNVWGRQGD